MCFFFFLKSIYILCNSISLRIGFFVTCIIIVLFVISCLLLDIGFPQIVSAFLPVSMKLRGQPRQRSHYPDGPLLNRPTFLGLVTEYNGTPSN